MGLFSSKQGDRVENRSLDTVIGKEAVFEGTLVTKNGVCVEGNFKGKLESEARVILNQGGRLDADVVAAYVTVHGEVNGNVRARMQLDVGETGVVRGDVEAAAVTVAKGGHLEGSCRMMSREESPKPELDGSSLQSLSSDDPVDDYAFDQRAGGGLVHREGDDELTAASQSGVLASEA